MSYLSLPRLTFSGLFEADVNTVNNDVRNYSSPTFEPRFQESWVQHADGKTTYNGWWNPDGGNTFRLLDCAVTGAVGPAGEATAGDTVLSLRIATQTARTAAKLVDLDPQYQFASGIWGLRIELTDGVRTLLAGTMPPACFRDVYFGRLVDKATGKVVGASPGASARFTGVLTDLVWHDDADASPVLKALKVAAAANQGRLSISLLTYGYSKSPNTTNFTYGRLLGTIAPWKQGEPETFAPGRRFSPSIADAADGPPSAYNIGYMNAAFTAGNDRVSVDYAIALPLWLLASGQPDVVDSQPIIPQDLGDIQLVVLTQPDTISAEGAIVTAINEGDTPPASDYVTIATLSGYSDVDWFKTTGGIIDTAVPDTAKSLVGDHPLALLIQVKGVWTVGIRESNGGQWARADNFIQRLDAPVTGWASSSATLYAMRYGAAFAGASIQLSLAAPDDTSGGAGSDQVDPPQAPIPTINIPADKIRMHAAITADDKGVATLTYHAADPGNPRGYIDGQIYEINYVLAGGGQSPLPMFEQVAVHVRDGFDPPITPSWDSDIAPVLVQYGNLYPIMSRGLFSFSNYDTVVQHARLLFLAFTRPPEDPNYMPATRDMSAGKLRMIVGWLSGYLKDASGDYGAVPPAKESTTLEPPAPMPPLGDVATRRGSEGLRKAIRSMGHGAPVPPGVKA